MEKIKYEVKRHANILWMLLIDGNDANCPNQNIFTGQTPMGQAGFVKQPCCTLCPLAELKKEGDQLTYTIHCGGQPRSINVTEFSDPIQQGQPGGKIIGMGN